MDFHSMYMCSFEFPFPLLWVSIFLNCGKKLDMNMKYCSILKPYVIFLWSLIQYYWWKFETSLNRVMLLKQDD